MCVEAYQFLFNGETKDATANASMAVFNISNTLGQAFPVMLEIYTLDYDEKRGQIPCTFTVIGKLLWRYTLVSLKLATS